MRLPFKIFLLGLLLTGCVTSHPTMPVSTPTIDKPITPTATVSATSTIFPASTITPTAAYREIKVSFTKEYTLLEGFVDHVNSLDWSGDGKTLIIASQQNYLVYFDTQSKKAAMSPSDVAIASIVLSPDRKTLAINSDSRFVDTTLVHFINLETGKTIRTIKVEKPLVFKGKTQIVYRSAGIFAPDGKTFILNSGRQVTLWDVASGNQIRELFQGDPNFFISGLFLNSAKNLLFTSYYKIDEWDKEKIFLRWDTNTWKLTKTFTGDFFGFSFSPDGNTFTPIGRNVNIVHSDSAEELFNFIGSQNLGLYNGELIAYHPSGKYVAIGNKGYITIYTNKGQFWNLLYGFTAEVLQFSPDGKQLAAGGGSGRPGLVAIWNNLNLP